jgi:hypothetical protein
MVGGWRKLKTAQCSASKLCFSKHNEVNEESDRELRRREMHTQFVWESQKERDH